MSRVGFQILLNTKEEIIKTFKMDVQKRRGSSYCGLFTIATATALAHVEEPPETYWFEHGKMCQHLLECLEKEHMTPSLVTLLTVC